MKCEYCGKRTRKSRITDKFLNYCCDNHRNYIWRKKERVKLKEKHRCINCKTKIKPVLVYHIRCKECLKKNRKNE